jgi:hypothetical protein
MRKNAFAFLAAAAMTTLGSVAAQALPSPPTAFVPQAGSAQSYSDGMFVFKAPPLTSVESFSVTNADINSCSTILVGGCFFDIANVPGLGVNSSMENKFTLVYEPDGVTLSDVFGVNCNGQTCDLAFLSKRNGVPIDLTGVDTSNFFAVTEIAGADSTVFDATYYLDPTWVRLNNGFARFVSANDVPEPVTVTLFGAGIAGLAVVRRRRKAAKAA